MGSQSKWDKLARIYDRDREIACRAYLDLIAGQKTKNVESALELNLGSPMLIEVPYVMGLMGDVLGKKVLDAGCGGGFYSFWLGSKGAEVLGIDSSREMIKIGKEKPSGRMYNVSFLVGNITDLMIEDGVFDLVLSALVLMEIKELDKAVSELVRVTRDGGDVVISILHPILTAGDWERESGLKLFRKVDDYFMERELETTWENERKERVSFKHYHKPLQAYVRPFLDRRCVLVSLTEPRPHKVYKIVNPTEFEDTKRIPHFIILKFIKQT